MLDFGKIRGFQWDQGNIDKSYAKHGITPNEAEEILLDEDLQADPDIKHAKEEKRYRILGKTAEGKILFAVFTIRKDQIRIISARPAGKKERSQYEQKAKKA